jgi:energy-converting hydrogenase Eha subunit E
LFYLGAVQIQYRNIRLILRSGDESFVLAGDVAEAQGIHVSLDFLQFHNGLALATRVARM